MKKIIFVLFFIFSFNFANAQFVGGEIVTNEVKVIANWDSFNKTLTYSNGIYYYTHILSSPKMNLVGVYESMILTISLGKNKEEVINTLNAYKNLIEKLGKNDQTTITDAITNTKYLISKDTTGAMKNTIMFLGETLETKDAKVKQVGYLSIKDIEKMINKL